MKTMITTAAWLAVLLTAGAAQAAEEENLGWRIGASAMVSTLDRSDGLIDDGTIGFKLFGQYKFTPWLGLEGAYYNSGEFASSAISADGAKVDLVYQGPIGKVLIYVPLPWESLEFFLNGGYYAFNVSSTIDDTNGGTGTDNGALFGGGLSIHVNDRMHFRSVIDWYDAQDADLWSVEVGLAYLF